MEKIGGKRREKFQDFVKPPCFSLLSSLFYDSKPYKRGLYEKNLTLSQLILSEIVQTVLSNRGEKQYTTHSELPS